MIDHEGGQWVNWRVAPIHEAPLVRCFLGTLMVQALDLLAQRRRQCALGLGPRVGQRVPNMQPLNEIINTDIVYGNQAGLRYIAIFYAVNSALAAGFFVLVHDMKHVHPELQLGAALANVHNICVGLLDSVAKTFMNRACLDFYELAYLRTARLGSGTASRGELSPRYRAAMMGAWEAWEKCNITVHLQVPQSWLLRLMMYMVLETYIGLLLLLAAKTAGLNVDFPVECAVAASLAEAVLILWHAVVVLAVMRDCKRRLALFFGVDQDAANKASWCCLRVQVAPGRKGDDWLALLPFEGNMPDISDLRYHMNPYLCKKYLGRDDGNYGICYFCC